MQRRYGITLGLVVQHHAVFSDLRTGREATKNDVVLNFFDNIVRHGATRVRVYFSCILKYSDICHDKTINNMIDEMMCVLLSRLKATGRKL